MTFTNFQLESVKYAPNPEVRQLYAKYHPEDAWIASHCQNIKYEMKYNNKQDNVFIAF